MFGKIFNFFRSKIEHSFEYLKKSKKFILISFLVFLIFSFIGFFINFPEEVSLYFLNYFEELIKETSQLGTFELILFLLSNNMSASFFGLFSGVFFGVFPFFGALLNGFVLGFASNLSVVENGFFSLFSLLPHGVFELPALFISLGLGLKLGWVFLKNFFKGDILKRELKNSFEVFIFIVLPLLALAAIIEGILISL